MTGFGGSPGVGAQVLPAVRERRTLRVKALGKNERKVLDPTRWGRIMQVSATSMEQQPGIKIPADELPPETLRSLIEEFVTRDGTNLSEAETKIRQVQNLLSRGEVEIWFDAATRTCNIVRA